MTDFEYTIGRDLDLKAEEEKTLSSERMKYGLLLGMMVLSFDLLYGRRRTLPKFQVLEILARYPYWAWENGAYCHLTWLLSMNKPAAEEAVRRDLELIDLGRESQDNEQWHMLLLNDLIRQKGIEVGWLKGCLFPRVLAFGYYYVSRCIFALNPAWSFAINAAFEDHAEHEYMMMARENPAWDEEEFKSVYYEYYPEQKTVADLIRRIGLDERDHKFASLEQLKKLSES